MSSRLSTLLLAAMLFCGAANASAANAQEPERAQKKERFAFPYFIPGSRIVLGEELVNEVNALASKDEQIQFLLKILPPRGQMDKRLSERQLYAIRLWGLTDSEVVIVPLLDRYDFAHTSDGWPAVHALARLGERAVEPIVKKLASVATDRQSVATLGAALIEIKNKQFPMLIDELRRRKDLKLSNKVLNELLDQYRLAPD